MRSPAEGAAVNGIARVTFKSADQERQFASGKLNPLLVGILYRAAQFAADIGWTLLLTEVWRSAEADGKLGGSGIHPAWRAVDIRTRDVPGLHVESVVKWINSRWQYDPLRPWMKVAYHKPHGTGPHIHLQVHARTRAR